MEKANKVKNFDIKLVVIIILSIIVVILSSIFLPNYYEKTDVSNYFENANIKFDCTNSNNDYVSTTLKEGEEITCSMGFNTYAAEEYEDYLFKNLLFEIKIGAGFELLESTSGCSSDYCVPTKNKNKFSIKYHTPDMIAEEPPLELKLKVKNNIKRDSLYILIDNIKFENKEKEIYQVEDVLTKYYIFTGKYYFYEDNYGSITIKPYQDIALEDSLKNSYECNNSNCDFISSESIYAIIKDENPIIYNIETGETTNIPKDIIENYNKYELVQTREKLYGIMLYNDKESGYYSIEQNKMIIPVNEYTLLRANPYSNVLEVVNKNNQIQLYDLKGNRYKPNDTYKIENSNYYYSWHIYIDENNYGSVIMDSTGKKLFDNNLVKEYKLLDQSQIIIINDKENKFLIYDKDQKIKESKTYKKVLNVLENYIIILDETNNINIIDHEENFVATITSIAKVDDYMYSYYDKTVDKIVTGVTNDKLEESGKGYEYVYNIMTNEINKLETEIHGEP